mgnify:CR=1 FL=1
MSTRRRWIVNLKRPTAFATLLLVLSACADSSGSRNPIAPSPAVAPLIPTSGPMPATFTVRLENELGMLGRAQTIPLTRPLPHERGEYVHLRALWRGWVTISRIPQMAAGAPDVVAFSCGGQEPTTSEPLGYTPGVIGYVPIVCAFTAPGVFAVSAEARTGGVVVRDTYTVTVIP